MMYSHPKGRISYDRLEEAQTFYSGMASDPRLIGNQQERYRRMALIAETLKDNLAINEDGSASIPLETIIAKARQEGISQGLSDNNLKRDIHDILRGSGHKYTIKITENRQAYIYSR